MFNDFPARSHGRRLVGGTRPGTALLAILLLTIAIVAPASAEQPDYVYETMIGGYYLGSGGDLVVDTAGNAYVVGSTYVDQVHLDILVFKIAPDGDVLWTRLIEGEDHDHVADVALGQDGDVYLTGFTDSEDFPITPDALDATLTGFRDVFLTRLSAADGSILYSTFLGGDYTDMGYGIAFDAEGAIYLTGSTGSTDFPTMNAYQDHPSAPLYVYTDAFITKLSPAGDAILYSTYFGGFEDDAAEHIMIEGDGDIVITGRTGADDFPLADPIQAAPRRIFVSRFTPDGATLEFSTYFGSPGGDRLLGAAMDASGAVYLTGSTQSEQFPTTPGAFQTQFVGEILGCGSPPFEPLHNCEDGYVSKLSTDGAGLVYSTYLGGHGVDVCWAIDVGADGVAHIAGDTGSVDFPGTVGAGDLFVSQLDVTGSELDYTLRRSSLSVGGRGIAVGPAGDVYVTGAVGSPAEVYVARLTAGATTGIAEQGAPPRLLRLGPSTPNPTSGLTRVAYTIAGQGSTPVHLAVFDATGHQVDVLVDAAQPAGSYQVSWDGRDASGARLPSGVYFYELRARSQRDAGRVLLMR